MRIEPVDQNAQLDNLNPQNSCIDYGELILPAAFTDAMSLEQQIFWLLVHKEDRLKAGENITLTRNQDGTVTVSATGGSSSDTTYRIIEVEPESGYVAAYALQNIDTQQISGETIQIPEGGSATTPVITATASVDSSTGTPSVDVSKTGTDEEPNFAFAFHNLKGETGASGRDGSDGEPGFSPSANVQQTSNGAIVTITDEFGTTQAEITNGSDGAPGQSGQDGFSPIANIQQTSGGAIITITDSNGTTTATISNGQNGQNGDDGVGISGITFKETDAQGNNIYTVTLTDGSTYDIVCARGPRGEQGPQGIPGTGEDGVGISNIVFTREDADGNYVYTITLSNNQTYEFTAPRGPQGVQGLQGVQGNPGVQGEPGDDGFSPVANVTSITNGVRITITDENGTTTQDVLNGSDGNDGAPGYSPTANIQQTSNGAIITITDENGTTTATITNGQSGSNGVGISGITFKETDANGNNVYTVTLTDGSTYDITCPKGATGSTGPAGPGVPAGGTDGQVLTKDGSTDYATRWETPSSGGLIAVRLPFSVTSGNYLEQYGGVIDVSSALAFKFNLVFLFNGSATENNFVGAYIEKNDAGDSNTPGTWGYFKSRSNAGAIAYTADSNVYFQGTSEYSNICYQIMNSKGIVFSGSGVAKSQDGYSSIAIPIRWHMKMNKYSSYGGYYLGLFIYPILPTGSSFGNSTGAYFKLF